MSGAPGSEEMMGDKEVSDKEVTIWGLVAVVLCMPVYFLVTHFSTAGQARAAAVCFGVLVIILRAFWGQRRQLWYWVTVTVVGLCQAFFVMGISWSSKSITAPILGLIAILDFILIYGVISLVKRFMKYEGSNP